jgi:predicted thioesterase
VKPSLQLGNQAEVTFRVTEEMCPAFDGVVVHHVCSTWTIVQFMEVAGRKILAPHLEADEEGVGSHVSCDHKGPAPVGSLVRVVATAVGLTDRELICETVATCGQKLVAVGKTAQRVFPKVVLRRILSSGQ